MLFESDHNEREKSMWQYTVAALQLLERCVARADAAAVTSKV